jgi:hypothetical protein
MANWDKIYRQAIAKQNEADELFQQAEDAQCSFEIQVKDKYGERRCKRDTGHSGDHHIDNFSD